MGCSIHSDGYDLSREMIGILDSGVGGLSVLREIRQLMPDAKIEYVGDSAWCPYGTKSVEEIQSRVFEITDYFLEQGAELVVVACNSATISAVEALRAAYPIPFVGMEPGIKPAAQLTKSGTVGVLATEASLSGEKFLKLVDTHAKNLRVLTVACPKFVDLVEKGQIEGKEVQAAIEEYAMPMVEEGADVLILGCTHYPFLKNEIRNVVPELVNLIDTGKAVAQRVSELVRAEQSGGVVVSTTGDVNLLQKIYPKLCQEIAVDEIRSWPKT